MTSTALGIASNAAALQKCKKKIGEEALISANLQGTEKALPHLLVSS